MSSLPPPGPRASAPAPYREAQLRICAAALDLFAVHGVSGTSLQMIADAIGVTKGAVYHQFRTKDEIVLAVAGMELAWLEAAIEVAEAEGCSVRAREVLLEQVIDLAVQRRHVVGVLQSDPVMTRFMEEHELFGSVMVRLFAVLTGADAGVETRVPAAMLTAAIVGSAAHPLIRDLDDDALRSQLLHLARRLLDLPADPCFPQRATADNHPSFN